MVRSGRPGLSLLQSNARHAARQRPRDVLKELDLPGVDFSTAKRFAQVALEAARNGSLGYAEITANK